MCWIRLSARHLLPPAFPLQPPANPLAISHYQALAELLREQVGVPPAAETAAPYRRLLGER